jgi:TolB protein
VSRLLLVLGALAAMLAAGCGGASEPRPDLVLVSSRDGDYALFELNADGGSQRRLTEAGEGGEPENALFFQVDPAWSPDGSSIAFASRRSGNFDIYVMRSDGTGTRRLTSAKDDEADPTWSPDGRRIAFAREGDVLVMKADGSGQRSISDETVEEAEPAWSPAGSTIAYVRRTPGTSVRELWLMRPDGSERRRLTRLGAASVNPAWSTDGARIAFASNAASRFYDIYVRTLDEKGVRRLTRSGDDAFEPAWSPTADTIAFSQGGALATVDLEGTVQELTDPDDNDSSPAWNPVPGAPDEG